MTMHISHQYKAVIVPFDAGIQQLLPHSKRINHEGRDVLAIRHGNDETRLLRNLGLTVPAPIVEHYDWPGARPFAQQVKTAAGMTMNPQFYVLNQMGTGKTKAALWAYDWLRKSGTVKRMLVVGPLSTLRFVWQREATMTIPGIKVVVLDGPRERRLKRLKEPADIYVVNHDGVSTILKELNMRRDLDVICIDEVGAYRNSKAHRSKMARELVKGRKYVWGMTGSPTPNSPIDAYGLAKLITPLTAPRSLTQFRNETMVQMSQFKWLPRPDAHETVADVLQPSVCFTLEDTIELPQVIERPYDVAQGTRQKAVYKEVADKMAAALREGTLTAANGGVALSKLLQISSGWVYIDSGKIAAFDNDARLTSMTELIDAAPAKVIVFAPFIHTVDGVEKHLIKEGLHYAKVTGATSSADRDDIFKRFQHTSEIDVLLAHPQCMSHGLTLTAADTIIWFSPITSLDIFQQANARITRVGQTRKQQVFMLQGTAAERKVYARLRQKRDVQESVLDLLKDLTA
jgi:SNF2 family DNA or RNA helicase